MRSLAALTLKLVIAASSRKPARLSGNRACAAAKLWQHGSTVIVDIAEVNHAP
jgi:hypothetical protein